MDDTCLINVVKWTRSACRLRMLSAKNFFGTSGNNISARYPYAKQSSDVGFVLENRNLLPKFFDWRRAVKGVKNDDARLSSLICERASGVSEPVTKCKRDFIDRKVPNGSKW